METTDATVQYRFPHRAKVTDQHLVAMCHAMAIAPGFAKVADALMELIGRRCEDVTTRGIERSFAFDHASGLIDSETFPVYRNGEPDFGWFDLATARNQDGELADYVEEAILYLDSRGLIERDPANPDWISIRDESEARDLQAPQASAVPA